MIYLVGARGRLGRAILASRREGEIVALDRSTYSQWWKPGAFEEVARYFDAAMPGSIVLVAAGVLDPALPALDHQRINVDLPIQIMEGALKVGLRVATFGTVMERLASHPNAYVASKAALGQQVAERSARGDQVTHLQVHTLYGGGEPAPFMFLGQLCQALRAHQPFEMSPGRQLREYHHVEDDVAALHAILDAGETGVLALSHGAPCTLRELATHVFEAMGCSELLRIGARPEPPDDNFATVLARPHVLDDVTFRPALEGVAQYVQTQIPARQQA
jgi:nucleoside-diphosphate-sugar epimerase